MPGQEDGVRCGGSAGAVLSFRFFEAMDEQQHCRTCTRASSCVVRGTLPCVLATHPADARRNSSSVPTCGATLSCDDTCMQ